MNSLTLAFSPRSLLSLSSLLSPFLSLSLPLLSSYVFSHPDHRRDCSYCQEKLLVIQYAFEILDDADKRYLYDATHPHAGNPDHIEKLRREEIENQRKEDEIR